MKKRLEITALTDKHSSRVLFLCCFCFYFLIYLGRLNYSAALAGITASGFLEKDAAGLISTSFFICYGAGQFFSGFTADRAEIEAAVAEQFNIVTITTEETEEETDK